MKEIDEVSQLTDSPVIKKMDSGLKSNILKMSNLMSILDIFNHSCYKELKNFQDHGF